MREEVNVISKEIADAKKLQEGKKEEEIKQADKDKITDLEKNETVLNDKKKEILTKYGKDNKLVKQLIDLALLSNNMLKGEELSKFLKRSIELMSAKK